MAGQETTRRAERAVLKRKLSGPLRLLLGKTQTRSEENEDNKEEMGNETTLRCSATAAQRKAKLKKGSKVEEETPPTGTCRGRCRNRRRCRRWRMFFSDLVCIKRNKKIMEKSSEKQQNDGSVQPKGALQENQEKSEKKRFNKRVWPKFRKSRTASDEQREEELSDGSNHPLNIQKNLLRFFIRKRHPQEDTMAVAEVQTDAVQEVTATVETAIKPVQYGTATERLLESTAGEMEEEVMEAQPKTAQSAFKVDDTTAGAPPVEVKVEVVFPEKVKVFCDSDEAGLDLHNELLISSEVSVEETAFQSFSEPLQTPANGPSILIELCPQEEEEEEEEEYWEASSSSVNPLLFLHLLGFDPSEQQLLQTARSLVRAAVNAAVVQLTREQQSATNCVQRDHA